ncbi:hypothetical protein [Myxococcus sp. Y35]
MKLVLEEGKSDSSGGYTTFTFQAPRCDRVVAAMLGRSGAGWR